MTRQQWHGGKGSIPRAVNKEKYESNFDKIFNKNKENEVKKKDESKDANRV